MFQIRNPLPLVRLVNSERSSETKSIAIIECLIMSVLVAVLIGYGTSLAPDNIILRSVIFGITLTYIIRSYVGYVTEE